MVKTCLITSTSKSSAKTTNRIEEDQSVALVLPAEVVQEVFLLMISRQHDATNKQTVRKNTVFCLLLCYITSCYNLRVSTLPNEVHPVPKLVCLWRGRVNI